MSVNSPAPKLTAEVKVRAKVRGSVSDNNSDASELTDKYPYQFCNYLSPGEFFIGRHFNATPAGRQSTQAAAANATRLAVM